LFGFGRKLEIEMNPWFGIARLQPNELPKSLNADPGSQPETARIKMSDYSLSGEKNVTLLDAAGQF
jgi:hypothetical protein